MKNLEEQKGLTCMMNFQDQTPQHKITFLQACFSGLHTFSEIVKKPKISPFDWIGFHVHKNKSAALWTKQQSRVDLFRVHISAKFCWKDLRLLQQGLSHHPVSSPFHCLKPEPLNKKIPMNPTVTSWNWSTYISHQVSSITKTGRNGKRKTLSHDAGATFTEPKRGKTPKKPTGMRNGKRGRKKTRRKTKLIYGMASTERFKITRHVHWSLTLMSSYVKILQDAWLFNTVC